MKGLWLAVDEVVHHDDVMPPVVVGSRQGIAGADADERDACLVEQHANEGKARLAFRRWRFRPVKEIAVHAVEQHLCRGAVAPFAVLLIDVGEDDAREEDVA